MDQEYRQEKAGALPNLEFLQFTFGRLGDAVYCLSKDGRVVFANDTACAELECTREEILNYNASDFDLNFSARIWERHWQDVKARGSFTFETEHCSKSGNVFPVEVRSNFFSFAGHDYDCSVVRNISERKQMEDSMRLSTYVYMLCSQAIMVTDANHRIVHANPALTRITGYELNELVGKSPGVLDAGRQGAFFYRGIWKSILKHGHWQGEIWGRKKSGETIACWVTVSPMHQPGGCDYRFVTQFCDITEKKLRDDTIFHYANYDSLTGLANRRLFLERLEYEIKKASRTSSNLGLLFIDLDDFKNINDRHGHDVGDKVLIESAQRLSKSVRETDTVSRYGGDEFTVMLPDCYGTADIERVIETIKLEFSKPLQIEGHSICITLSIGIAIYPEDAMEVGRLLKQADHAMFNSKNNGTSQFSYASEAKRSGREGNAFHQRMKLFQKNQQD